MIEAGWSWFPDWWAAHYRVLLEQPLDAGLIARYAVQGVGTSLPIFIADYLFGLVVLRLLGARLAGPLRHAAALGAGTAAAALGLFLFGSLGKITARGVLIFTIVEGLVGLAFAWKLVRWPRLRLKHLWLLPFLVVLMPDLMMPVLEYDSTMYHMAAAKHYMEQHKTLYHEGIRFNAQPHMPVMLYLRQWWLVNDANLIKLVNLEYLTILACVFAWMARRYRVQWGMLAAFALALGSPIFGYVVRQEYADLALTSWLTVGVCVLVAQGGRLEPSRLMLAGVLLGAAGASKLQGLLVTACFVSADAVVWLWRKRDVMQTVRRGLYVGLPVLVVGIPWWVRGWRYTGSPFYPFLSDSPDVKALFEVNARYGVGRDLFAFLAMPWHMITVEPYVYADLYRFGPSCLVLLVVAALALLLKRGKVDAGTLVSVGGSLLFTVLWFRSGQVMRYEACLLPVWGMLLLSSVRRLGWKQPVVPVLLLPLLVGSMALASSVVRYSMPPPVSWPATQMVLNAVLPYYRATQAAAHVVKPDEMVYTWFCDDIRAYSPGRSYGDWFGGYTYTWLGNVHSGVKITEPAALVARLKASGFRYIIVDRMRAKTGGTIYGAKFLESGLVKRFVPVPGTETVFDDGRYAVLRLT